jgi:hypothetical protein
VLSASQNPVTKEGSSFSDTKEVEFEVEDCIFFTNLSLITYTTFYI